MHNPKAKGKLAPKSQNTRLEPALIKLNQVADDIVQQPLVQLG